MAALPAPYAEKMLTRLASDCCCLFHCLAVLTSSMNIIPFWACRALVNAEFVLNPGPGFISPLKSKSKYGYGLKLNSFVLSCIPQSPQACLTSQFVGEFCRRVFDLIFLGKADNSGDSFVHSVQAFRTPLPINVVVVFPYATEILYKTSKTWFNNDQCSRGKRVRGKTGL